MFYDRKIKYLDYFEDGERVKGGGFIKLEARDNLLRMDVTVTGLYTGSFLTYDIILLSSSQESIVGRITVSGGKGQFRQLYNNLANIGGTGIPYGELQGIRIPMGASRELSCSWTAMDNNRKESHGQSLHKADTRQNSVSPAAPQADAEGALGKNKKNTAKTSAAAAAGRKSDAENLIPNASAKQPPNHRNEASLWDVVRESSEKDTAQQNNIPDLSISEKAQRTEIAALSANVSLPDASGDISPENGSLDKNGFVNNNLGSLDDNRFKHSASGNNTCEDNACKNNTSRSSSSENNASRNNNSINNSSETSGFGDDTSGSSNSGNDASGNSGSRNNTSGNSGSGNNISGYSTSGNTNSGRKRRDHARYMETPIQKGSRQQKAEIIDTLQEKRSQREAAAEGRNARAGLEPQKESGMEAPASRVHSDQRQKDAAGKPIQPLEDKWMQLCAIYPHIHPFRDKREYLSIGPGDFVLFPSASYKMINNSFLLHGFYNYNHLILARVEQKGEPVYYIGVPGNYFEKEKQVAIMFGFESFECEEEPAQIGDFGYYMMRTQL